jgi:hypothetical protein
VDGGRSGLGVTVQLTEARLSRRDAARRSRNQYPRPEEPQRRYSRRDFQTESFLCPTIDQIVRSLRAIAPAIETAEYAEYAEGKPAGRLFSAYFAYSAVNASCVWLRLHKKSSQE